MKAQTKAEAIHTIVWDAKRQGASASSFKRVLRALRTLGLEGDELKYALSILDYVDRDGKPYPWTKVTEIPK